MTSEKLKSALFGAFQTQKEYIQQSKDKFPIIEERLTKISEVAAGQDVSTVNLADVLNDLQVILESFQSLGERANLAIQEASIAAYALKEYEDDPDKVLGYLMDVMVEIANEDVFAQSNRDFVAKVAELVLPKTRRKAIEKLTTDALQGWAGDIAEELENRESSLVDS